MDGNHGSTIGYAPNSFDEWAEQPEFKNPGLDVSGAAYQYDFYEDDSDFYTTPGKLFRPHEALKTTKSCLKIQLPLWMVYLISLKNAMQNIATNVIQPYGEGVAKALGMNIDFSDVK